MSIDQEQVHNSKILKLEIRISETLAKLSVSLELALQWNNFQAKGNYVRLLML